MIDCLYNYIGLSSKTFQGDPEVESSGLFVDALPDISLNLISKLTESDEDDSQELWQTIEKRSILKFRTFFINAINQCYKINKVDICECIICENVALLSTSLWYLMGAEVMFERYSSSRLNKYTTIDKPKAKDLRDEYMDIFNRELAVAVAGIDIQESICTPDEGVACNNLISTHYTIM